LKVKDKLCSLCSSTFHNNAALNRHMAVCFNCYILFYVFLCFILCTCMFEFFFICMFEFVYVILCMFEKFFSYWLLTISRDGLKPSSRKQMFVAQQNYRTGVSLFLSELQTTKSQWSCRVRTFGRDVQLKPQSG
jgi:hypothetical protein